MTRFVSFVPTAFSLCSGLSLSLLAWYQWRAQRHPDNHPLDGRSHELLLLWLLLMGAVMLGLFVIYALFGTP
jgi:Tfp pilus assembly protein PilN